MEKNPGLIQGLIDITTLLDREAIPYALAGGLAYSALIEPRATMDIDIVILMKETSMPDFFGSLKKKFKESVPHKKPIKFPVITIWRYVRVVEDNEIIYDFLLAPPDFHQSILDRALPVTFAGSPLKVVSLEDLVILKKCADRARDRADLEEIYARFSEELDNEYINFWMKKLEKEY